MVDVNTGTNPDKFINGRLQSLIKTTSLPEQKDLLKKIVPYFPHEYN